MDKYSLWIGLLGPDLNRETLIKAHKLWKPGFTRWSDLVYNNQWDIGKIQSAPFHLRYLLLDRINFAQQVGLWPPSPGKWLLSHVCQWNTGNLLYLSLLSLLIMICFVLNLRQGGV